MKTTIKNEILSVVKRHNTAMTVGQIAKYIPRRSREGVLKRISELAQEDRLTRTGTTRCPVTKRTSTLYEFNPNPNPGNQQKKEKEVEKALSKLNSKKEHSCNCFGSCSQKDTVEETDYNFKEELCALFDTDIPEFELSFFASVIEKTISSRITRLFIKNERIEYLQELAEKLRQASVNMPK